MTTHARSFSSLALLACLAGPALADPVDRPLAERVEFVLDTFDEHSLDSDRFTRLAVIPQPDPKVVQLELTREGLLKTYRGRVELLHQTSGSVHLQVVCYEVFSQGGIAGGIAGGGGSGRYVRVQVAGESAVVQTVGQRYGNVLHSSRTGGAGYAVVLERDEARPTAFESADPVNDRTVVSYELALPQVLGGEPSVAERAGEQARAWVTETCGAAHALLAQLDPHGQFPLNGPRVRVQVVVLELSATRLVLRRDVSITVRNPNGYDRDDLPVTAGDLGIAETQAFSLE